MFNYQYTFVTTVQMHSVDSTLESVSYWVFLQPEEWKGNCGRVTRRQQMTVANHLDF